MESAKAKKVNHVLSKLYHIARRSFEKKDFDTCLSAINASANLQYQWNQRYTDDALESLLLEICRSLKENEGPSGTGYTAKGDTVLFYDSFGLDTRGLALIYTKALCDLGYRLIYVVPANARGNQPEIHKNTQNGDITFCYLSHRAGVAKVQEIRQIFEEYQPAHAFFYTTPNDGEACIAFSSMAGLVSRYQINLTDHAFWLGVNAFDYCLEFREYGACVSVKYRHIAPEKLRLLPYYPFIDKTIPFAGFDFDTEGKRILFSGGALYKTMDAEGTYYHIVAEILRRHPDILFLYAGFGNDAGLKELARAYPGRVIHIRERKDLYALLCHTTLYLNTYPMIGGLMSQYAAAAGKPPMTLVHDEGSTLDGLVLNHKELDLEFTREEDLLAEVDELLAHEEKLSMLGRCCQEGVLTEESFQQGLSDFLKEKSTGFPFEIHDMDTEAFRHDYIGRFSQRTMENALCNPQTKRIWKYFPKLVACRFVKRLGKKILRRRK